MVTTHTVCVKCKCRKQLFFWSASFVMQMPLQDTAKGSEKRTFHQYHKAAQLNKHCDWIVKEQQFMDNVISMPFSPIRKLHLLDFQHWQWSKVLLGNSAWLPRLVWMLICSCASTFITTCSRCNCDCSPVCTPYLGTKFTSFKSTNP